jgi:glycosyltransferase involved in cell wall biosynthesis
MKILFLTRRFFPHIGGVEKHVLEVSRNLIAKGHNITIITEQNEPDKKENETIAIESENIRIIRIDAGSNDWFKKLRIWKEMWKKRSYFEDADIVHCHDVFFWYLPFRFLHPTKNVYITFHGYETKYPISKRAIFIRKLSEMMSNGNIIIGDFIKKWYGTKPNFISYGGAIDYNSLDSVLKTKISKLRIIFIGRLESDLGLETYMKALIKLKNKKINFTFTAYGEGIYRKKLLKFGRIRDFTENIQKAMNKADIIFCSSYLLMLDALINKNIVIAVHENPVKEDYLKMSPFSDFVYICKNSDEVVDVISYIKKDPWKSKAMIDRGYEWAKNQTWEKVTKQYLELWKL